VVPHLQRVAAGALLLADPLCPGVFRLKSFLQGLGCSRSAWGRGAAPGEGFTPLRRSKHSLGTLAGEFPSPGKSRDAFCLGRGERVKGQTSQEPTPAPGLNLSPGVMDNTDQVLTCSSLPPASQQGCCGPATCALSWAARPPLPGEARGGRGCL